VIIGRNWKDIWKPVWKAVWLPVTADSYVTESVSLTDDQAAVATFAASNDETLALSDGQTVTAIFSAVEAESVALVDEQTASAAFSSAQDESIALIDGQDATSAASVEQVGESFSLHDAQTATGGVDAATTEDLLDPKYLANRNVRFKAVNEKGPEDPLPEDITNMPDAPPPGPPSTAKLARGLSLAARVFDAPEVEAEAAPIETTMPTVGYRRPTAVEPTPALEEDAPVEVEKASAAEAEVEPAAVEDAEAVALRASLADAVKNMQSAAKDMREATVQTREMLDEIRATRDTQAAIAKASLKSTNQARAAALAARLLLED